MSLQQYSDVDCEGDVTVVSGVPLGVCLIEYDVNDRAVGSVEYNCNSGAKYFHAYYFECYFMHFMHVLKILVGIFSYVLLLKCFYRFSGSNGKCVPRHHLSRESPGGEAVFRHRLRAFRAGLVLRRRGQRLLHEPALRAAVPGDQCARAAHAAIGADQSLHHAEVRTFFTCLRSIFNVVLC